MRRRTLGWVDWIGVMVVLVLVAALTLPAIARAREGARRASCAANLRRLGLSLSFAAAENHGVFPPMKARDCTGAPAGWDGAVEPGSLYPEYLDNLDVFVCPDSEGPATALERWDDGDGVLQPCEVSGIPYVYIGWALPPWWMDAADVDAFAGQVKSFGRVLGAEPDAVQDDWLLDSPILGRDTLYRLRDGIARYQVTDICNEAASNQARKKTAIMWDAVSGRDGEGANVLFMDGHVEFMPWQDGLGRFPVNDAGAALSKAVSGE